VLDGPHEFAGLTLDDIARRIAAPFGVTVEAEVAPGPPFPRFAIQPGETAWEALERAAKARGILLAGSGTGVLRLTRASEAQPAAGPIELGVNVRRANGGFDHAGRHSVVCVRGQAEGGGTAAGAYDPATGAPEPGGAGLIAARSQARQTDPAIGRYRPRVVVAETAGAAASFADRAAWEMRAAAGRSIRVGYVVPGWRGASGALWRTMTLVRVKDHFLGVDADLLIAGVVFSLTPEGGSLTEVEVTLPDAFDVQAVPLKQAAGARGGGAERGLFEVTSGRPVRVELPGAAA
jgi:prophage tail gpP-like protein